MKIIKGDMVWHRVWSQSLTFSEVKYQPVSLVARWVATGDIMTNPHHLTTCYNRPYTNPQFKTKLITFKLMTLDVKALTQ